MARALWYNDAATWVKTKALWYNDAATWRKAKALWYNDAGTWRQVFASDPSNPAFTASPMLTSTASGYLTATVKFNTDGTANSTGIAPPAWAASPAAGVGTGVWVRVDPTSSINTTYHGSAMSTWFEITAAISFSFRNSGTTLEGTGQASVSFSLDAGASTAATLANGINWDVGCVGP